MSGSAAQRFVSLSTGVKMPLLGFGTYQIKEARQLRLALNTAIKVGYRHIDTAFAYENEHLIGDAMKEMFDTKLVKREDLFITTKLFSSFHRRHRVIDALKWQLKSLQLDHVDLYLIHFPIPFFYNAGDENLISVDNNGRVVTDPAVTLEDTWHGMQDCIKAGLARSVGLSNCNSNQVDRVIKASNKEGCLPVVNQVELNPIFQNKKLAKFCQEKEVAITAYSPLGSPGTLMPGTEEPLSKVKLFEDKCLVDIGIKYKKTPAQVILRWLIQQNIAAVPKSTTPARIVENFNIWDFELSGSEMSAISKLDTNQRIMESVIPGLNDHPEYPFKED